MIKLAFSPNACSWPGSLWENGYIEFFNGKMRDELLSREIFYSLKEAQVLIEMWRDRLLPSAKETIIRPG
jgi:hypothetical protein